MTARAGSRRAPRDLPSLRAAVLALLLLPACCPCAVLLGEAPLPCPPAAPPPSPPPAPAADVFLLLPDGREGKSAIAVSAAGAERVVADAMTAVSVSPGSAPGEPYAMTEGEVHAMFGDALEALPAPPRKFVLYFRQDAAELTPDSAAGIAEVVRAVRERDSRDVSVVGHADTVGNREHNLQLSLKRARAVAALLEAAGVPPALLDVASHGKDNPLVPTGDQVAEPRNRRVEVTVR